MKCKFAPVFLIIYVLVFFTSGCKEFENNNFSSFIGVIVDEEGRPVAGLDLLFVAEPQWWNLDAEVTFDRIIYQQQTNNLGEFRFVVPRNNLNERYGIGVEEPNRLVFERFAEEVAASIVPVNSDERDGDGVIQVGLIQLRRP